MNNGETAVKTDAQIIEVLQGYGERLNVFTGMKDGKPQYKTYHIAPVPLVDIPELTKILSEFQAIAGKMEKKGGAGFTAKDALKGVEMVKMGLKRTQPEVDDEEILNHFNIGLLMKVARIMTDINDLGVEMDKEGNVIQNPTMPIRR